MPGIAKGTVSYSSANPSRPEIPLVAEVDVDPTASIGSLVKDATVHLSTLIRAEIELAKQEIGASVKTGLIGAIFFIGAAAIGVFALFFFPFVFAEVLSIWLKRWLSFVIVFVLMLVIAGALVVLGIRKVKKIKKPERTISTLSDTATALKAAAAHTPEPGPGRR